MLGGDGDPDRGRRRHRLAEDVEGRVHGIERALGQLVDGQLIDESGEEDGELVAAHPGHRVLAAHGVDQSLAHLLDKDVPGGMPEGVVDGLEIVEVDEEHADRLADAAGPHQLLLDPVLEQPAVREPGESVVPRHVRHLLQELEVLDGDGGLVGQPGEAFVKVEIVDRPSGVAREVGSDHSEEVAGSEERSDH